MVWQGKVRRTRERQYSFGACARITARLMARVNGISRIRKASPQVLIISVTARRGNPSRQDTNIWQETSGVHGLICMMEQPLRQSSPCPNKTLDRNLRLNLCLNFSIKCKRCAWKHNWCNEKVRYSQTLPACFVFISESSLIKKQA